MSEPEHIGSIIDRCMLQLALRARLRELESQIDFGTFDPDLSAEIDRIRFLLGE
jgi:hypothetical protein